MPKCLYFKYCYTVLHCSVQSGTRQYGEDKLSAPGHLSGHNGMLPCRDHSVSDGLEYVAAYNAAMLPSSDIQEVFKAVVKERRAPKFSKL